MKRVLGISFGREMKNSEILVKTALMECQEAGYEIEFLRACDLDIKNCTGCMGCVVGMTRGLHGGDCVLKDDFHILMDAILRADAVIIGSPVYETSPTGLYKTVCDRIGPSHDISFCKAAIEEGLAAGKDPAKLPDQRLLDHRIGALIAAGGAMTENWLSMSIPIMYEFTFPLGIDVIDTYECCGLMAEGHVVGSQNALARAAKIGRNIADALSCTTIEDRVRWRGELQGACPVCHCNLIRVTEDGDPNKIECPVCGIRGKLSLEDGVIKTYYSAEEILRSRLHYGGKLEHSTEIKTQSAPPTKIPDLQDRLKKYRGIGEKEGGT